MYITRVINSPGPTTRVMWNSAPAGGRCTNQKPKNTWHHSDVIMSAMVSQITGVSIVCSFVCLFAYQRKHQSPASLTFVREIHWSPVDSACTGPVTRKFFHLVTSSWIFTAVLGPYQLSHRLYIVFTCVLASPRLFEALWYNSMYDNYTSEHWMNNIAKNSLWTRAAMIMAVGVHHLSVAWSLHV